MSAVVFNTAINTVINTTVNTLQVRNVPGYTPPDCIHHIQTAQQLLISGLVEYRVPQVISLTLNSHCQSRVSLMGTGITQFSDLPIQIPRNPSTTSSELKTYALNHVHSSI